MVHHDKRLSKLIKIKTYNYKLYVFLHLHVLIFIKNNNYCVTIKLLKNLNKIQLILIKKEKI